MTIGFHSLILGWSDTDLGDLFMIVKLLSGPGGPA